MQAPLDPDSTVSPQPERGRSSMALAEPEMPRRGLRPHHGASMSGMSLKTRITLIVALAASTISACVYGIQHHLIFAQFLDLERKEAVDDLRRCEDAVNREVQHLSVFCADWAAWDDMYKYFGDRNAEFFTANLTDSSMANARCDAEWLV